MRRGYFRERVETSRWLLWLLVLYATLASLADFPEAISWWADLL